MSKTGKKAFNFSHNYQGNHLNAVVYTVNKPLRKVSHERILEKTIWV